MSIKCTKKTKPRKIYQYKITTFFLSQLSKNWAVKQHANIHLLKAYLYLMIRRLFTFLYTQR